MALTRLELERFFRELEVPLYNFSLRWVFRRAQAEELVQEAFAIVWKKRESVEAETLKGLLYKTVQNLSLSELRKRKVRDAFARALPFFGEAEPAPGSERELIEAEEMRAMEAALESIPLEFREALLLCELSDMTQAEIAASLGIAAGTVASRRNRALALLRGRLERGDGGVQPLHTPEKEDDSDGY